MRTQRHKPKHDEVLRMAQNAINMKIEPLRLFSTEVIKIDEGEYKGFYKPKKLAEISKPIEENKTYKFYHLYPFRHRKRGKFKCYVMVYKEHGKEEYILIKVPITLMDYLSGGIAMDVPIHYPLPESSRVKVIRKMILKK